MNQTIEAIRQTARDRYETSYGWSMIEECFTDQEILKEIHDNNLETIEQAIAHFDSIANLHTELYDEARSEIF